MQKLQKLQGGSKIVIPFLEGLLERGCTIDHIYKTREAGITVIIYREKTKKKAASKKIVAETKDNTDE